jgi:thiol-disulfide isomerase/thioredoxin
MTMNLFRTITICFLFALTQIPIHGVASAGEIAPKFWISNLEGKQFKSKNQTAPYIISFFFVDCIPCKKEIPQLYELITNEYPDVNLLFINPIAVDSVEEIQKFAKARNVPTEYFYHDSLGTIARKFRIKGVFPTIVGINKNRIVFRLNDLSERSLTRLKKGL